jgi:hypothetical protein
MTEQAEGKPALHEVPPQFPALTGNQGNFTYHLTLDKSVNKAFAKFIAVIVVNSILIGAAIILAIWMIIAYQETEREVRLQRLETDEMNVRLELARIPKHQPGDKP